MRKALFLDRDGVINLERDDYVWKPEDFRLCPNIAKNLKVFQDANYLLIVITNQGGIAKGLYEHADVKRTHAYMKDLLAAEGVQIDEIYYSPYHDSKGKSLGRKPGSLLFEKAIYSFDIDPKQSFMIGDKERDTIPAEKLGIKSFLIEKNTDINFVLSHIQR